MASDQHEQSWPEQDFDNLIERFRPIAYRWAYLRLDDPQLAEDAVQEAFLIAYMHRDELRERAAFPGWLRQIVNTSCNRLTRRKQVLQVEMDDEYVDDLQGAIDVLSSPDPSLDFEAQEAQDAVKTAINDLPHHERTLVEMFYFADYSQQEIAQQLAVPVTTVKKRLQYAREHLKAMMLPNASLVHPLFDSDFEKWQWHEACYLGFPGAAQGIMTSPFYDGMALMKERSLIRTF